MSTIEIDWTEFGDMIGQAMKRAKNENCRVTIHIDSEGTEITIEPYESMHYVCPFSGNCVPSD